MQCEPLGSSHRYRAETGRWVTSLIDLNQDVVIEQPLVQSDKVRMLPKRSLRLFLHGRGLKINNP